LLKAALNIHSYNSNPLIIFVCSR